MSRSLVLITGATGMIGFGTLVMLLQSGYRVRAAVRDQTGFDRIKSLKPVVPFISQLESFVVTDITAPGAYDQAVKDVDYIIHIASPLAHPKYANVDFEAEVIQPAIRGTVGILKSAKQVQRIKKIVITGSIFSIYPTHPDSSVVVDETSRSPAPSPPYSSLMEAYAASKAAAYQATKEYIESDKPSFDVINIMPTFVIGRDNTVTDPTSIGKGTNGLVMGPALGHEFAEPVLGVTVHLDDVVNMHVKALDPSIQGNQDFLASSNSPDGTKWGESFDIIKKNYPKQCDDGVFKVQTTPRLRAWKLLTDTSKAEKTFGFKFKPFEDQVASVVDHFLELIGRD